MKLKYVGESMAYWLTDGKVYECFGVKGDSFIIRDDEGERNTFTILNPAYRESRLYSSHWEVVEDDGEGTLQAAIEQQQEIERNRQTLKVRYVGESFGVAGLTDGKVYECLGVEMDGVALRIIDDGEEDYLYSASNPAPLNCNSSGGRWEIVEDDDKGTLKAVLG